MAPGQILGVLRGSARSILVAERIMLNFMQVGECVCGGVGGGEARSGVYVHVSMCVHVRTNV